MEVQELSPKFPFHSSEGRSFDKLHLSDIYSDLEATMWPKLHQGQNNKFYSEVGFLFEEALSAAFRDRLGVRIGEIEKDGIIGSPDGVNFETWTLEEYKCTWRSVKYQPQEIWRWMAQVKGYLKMLDMTKCHFRILYLNGNYAGSGPIYKEYLLTFTLDEIEINWTMLLSHAKNKGWI